MYQGGFRAYLWVVDYVYRSSYHRPVVVKLKVPTYTLALLFALTFILKITKAFPDDVLKLQPVDSLPFMPTVCQVLAVLVTVVSDPQADIEPDSFRYI